ncbi:MAG: HD domain-containing protein [Oscillospiraceae bacterium]|nr:HD domain-containing protein [Oscillospiraceae bacterium]
MSEVEYYLRELERDGRFGMERAYPHHGDTSVYTHSVHVAKMSLKLSRILPGEFHSKELIRGALLHDYYLYNWHNSNEGHRLHGFHHAKTALRNAKADYKLTPIEENIIEHHMFPLNPAPPTCREAWIVCVADKVCAVRELIGK